MPSYNANQELEIRSQKSYFFLLIVGTGILFFIIFIRLFYLQIYKGEELLRYSDINRFKKQFLSAPRGLIYDRNQNILVGNKNLFQLKFNLNYISDLEEVIKKIQPIINLSSEEIHSRLKQSKKKYGHFHPITIKEDLTLEEVHQINLLNWDYPGVYSEEKHVRIYPLKDNGAQILGYVGEISKQEIQKLQQKNQFSHPMNIVGKSGIEKEYNTSLTGIHGWNFVEVDALNRISSQTTSPPFFLNHQPKKGLDITLTLDKDLQEFVYKSMHRKDAIGHRKGAVIVMKTNGEILAWVSLPSFDSNNFTSELDQQKWQHLVQSEKKLFLNKGFQEHYSPGSTFKPIIAIAALAENIIKKNTRIDSPSYLQFGNRIFRDNVKSGHGKIHVVTALEKSANTFFYQVGAQLGIKAIEFYAQLFGFGKKTQIQLAGEKRGLLPNPQWKKQHAKTSWRRGDTVNMSIGQGSLLSTLLQLTVAYNAIATEGLLVKPFLVKKIGDQIFEHKVLDTLTDRIDKKHFITVKQGLKKVTQGREGTARFWKVKNASYGGKTGTSQVISLGSKKIYTSCTKLPVKKKHHGLFISFAPANHPEIIVSVLAEHSCFGSIGAVPVARDIVEYYAWKKGNQ